LAVKLFSIFATLDLWKLNPRLWLMWFLQACATAGGRAPPDISGFLPWNLTEEQRAALSDPVPALASPLNSACQPAGAGELLPDVDRPSRRLKSNTVSRSDTAFGSTPGSPASFHRIRPWVR
jgi:hypothetical protein